MDRLRDAKGRFVRMTPDWEKLYYLEKSKRESVEGAYRKEKHRADTLECEYNAIKECMHSLSVQYSEAVRSRAWLLEHAPFWLWWKYCKRKDK